MASATASGYDRAVKKHSRRRGATRFPIATIAAYGPDNTRATKLVVSIIQRMDREPREMRTWTSDAADIRADEAISAEVRAFTARHRVKQVVASPGIIGCPHQEGIDYPMGRSCPQCAFWVGIDRFTHEPIPAPEASMSADDVISVLAADSDDVLGDALLSADAHRDALVGPLLEALERGIANPLDASEEEGSLFSYALYLLASWREPRAYPYVIRWLRLPEEEPFMIAGDVVTQDGGRILAGVCDGDLEPIKELILDREADEWGRSAGVRALTLLAAWAEVPRDAVIDWLVWLAREGLERAPSAVWDSLASDCADIEALDVFPELRRAYDEELIEPISMDRSELDGVEGMERGEMTRMTREQYPPIQDVGAETSWWVRGVGDSDRRR